LEELGKSGNASPLDKTKQRWLVYWHTLEEWGDIIYNWAQENGFTGSVCTFFELTQGEDTSEQGILYNLFLLYLSVLLEITINNHIAYFRISWSGYRSANQVTEDIRSCKKSRDYLI